MKMGTVGNLVLVMAAFGAASASAQQAMPANAPATIGRHRISTLPFDPKLSLRSGTFMASGKLLVSYADKGDADRRNVKLATMDDDGRNMRPFFAQRLPDRPKDNGIRFMPFADNKRIFLGDFIIECLTTLDTCTRPALHPVIYPAEVADGDHISHRWSEMIISPDNRHVAWTTLLANFSAVVFVGELRKEGANYRIVDTRIISTLDPFRKDPKHADGMLPQPIRGGEVKQFIDGGNAISLVGAVRRDTPDSAVDHLDTGRVEGITDTAGYTETTIFSPDERLGATMTTRFSKTSDPAILGLLPRPYPGSLNMGISMFAYTYSVTGVRRGRPGSVGPALIDIQASKTVDGYQGIDLSTDEDWVFGSPLSWHPGGTKASWMEGRRGGDEQRMQIVTLSDYRPGKAPPLKVFPASLPGSTADLSLVKPYAATGRDIDVKVYGKKAGYIRYRRDAAGMIEKTYAGFSDDGRSTYNGSERLQANPRGQSTYVAKVALTGPKPGAMDLTLTFGPLTGERPAGIIFAPDRSGTPATRGYAEYDGKRLNIDALVP